ncbi:MAG: ion transporter, partial [Salinivirgaceae bacterium]
EFMEKRKRRNRLRLALYKIIFQIDTRAGKIFDEALLFVILLSVALVMLYSVQSIHMAYGDILYAMEWGITIVFTIEYLLRLWVHRRPGRYAFSFFGVIDLLAALPTYFSLIFVGTQYLTIVRALRLLRIFRILKLTKYTQAGSLIMKALHASRQKIVVFLYAVIILVIMIGSLMYTVEGAENGFTSIPRSIYWSIVTLTTVGYGDISPQTELGQFFASIVMILGYAIIAVPTGIVSAEMVKGDREDYKVCNYCKFSSHAKDAAYCKICGHRLPDDAT